MTTRVTWYSFEHASLLICVAGHFFFVSAARAELCTVTAMLRKLHLAISRSYSTHNTNDHISLLAVFVCLSSAFALSDLNDIRNYFAGEISSVQVEKVHLSVNTTNAVSTCSVTDTHPRSSLLAEACMTFQACLCWLLMAV